MLLSFVLSSSGGDRRWTLLNASSAWSHRTELLLLRLTLGGLRGPHLCLGLDLRSLTLLLLVHLQSCCLSLGLSLGLHVGRSWLVLLHRILLLLLLHQLKLRLRLRIRQLEGKPLNSATCSALLSSCNCYHLVPQLLLLRRCCCEGSMILLLLLRRQSSQLLLSQRSDRWTHLSHSSGLACKLLVRCLLPLLLLDLSVQVLHLGRLELRLELHLNLLLGRLLLLLTGLRSLRGSWQRRLSLRCGLRQSLLGLHLTCSSFLLRLY